MQKDQRFVEKKPNEAKGILAGLLKTAKKDEKIILSEVRIALEHAIDAGSLITPYKEDVFGVSYAIRWHRRQKKFIAHIKEALQASTDAKQHLPEIKNIEQEIKTWLSKGNRALLPEEDKIIKELQNAEKILESAITDLTRLNGMRWGSASSAFLMFGMYYLPVEHDTEIGLHFRTEWVKPLHRAIESLTRFEKIVEDAFRLQSDINKKYRD